MKVSFHNVDHSDALQSFIEKKSRKLSKNSWVGERFSWVIEKDANEFKPVLRLSLKDRIIPVSARSHNAFKAVNEVFDKAKRLLKDAHQKRIKSL